MDTKKKHYVCEAREISVSSKIVSTMKILFIYKTGKSFISTFHNVFLIYFFVLQFNFLFQYIDVTDTERSLREALYLFYISKCIA